MVQRDAHYELAMPEDHFTSSTVPLTGAPRGRLVEHRIFHEALSGAEQRRLVELLCTGIERRLKQHGDVDFPPDVLVDADAPKEDDRWPE